MRGVFELPNVVCYHHSMPQSRPEIKTLIWDVDGVLVNTELLHFQGWRKLLQELGHNLTLEEYRPLIGHGGINNMAVMCKMKSISGDIDELTKRRRAIYLGLRKLGIPVIAENVALLKQFADAYPALTQIAASNSVAAEVHESLQTAGVDGLLKFVISYKDHPEWRRKPAPDLYLAAIKELGLPAANCLAFEDTESGVTAAKAAGVRVVALPGELTAGQDFSSADLVIAPGRNRGAKAIMSDIARHS